MLASTHVERDELGGGRVRDTIHVKRIAYYQDGSPKRLAFDLGASGDPAYPVGVNNGDLYFRLDTAIAGKSPLLTFGKGQSRVAIACLDANNVSGTVSGQAVTFPNAWDNADLTLTYGGHILRKDIALRAGHPSRFAFRIDDHANFDPATLKVGEDFYIAQPVLLSPDGLGNILLAWDVSSSGGKYILTCVLPSGDYAGWTLDPTLTLQPDATDGKDNRMIVAVNTNYGTNTQITGFYSPGNTQHSVIEFDVTGAVGTITAATLYLYISDAVNSYADTLIDVYEIAAGNADWTEDKTTWVYKDKDTMTDWAGSQGCSTSGTDYNAAVIGTLTVPNPVVLNGEFSTALTPAIVDGWRVSNPGMFIRARVEAGTTGAHIWSSDHTTAGLRPKLVVDYTLAAAAGWGVFRTDISPIFGGLVVS